MQYQSVRLTLQMASVPFAIILNPIECLRPPLFPYFWSILQNGDVSQYVDFMISISTTRQGCYVGNDWNNIRDIKMHCLWTQENARDEYEVPDFVNLDLIVVEGEGCNYVCYGMGTLFIIKERNYIVATKILNVMWRPQSTSICSCTHCSEAGYGCCNSFNLWRVDSRCFDSHRVRNGFVGLLERWGTFIEIGFTRFRTHVYGNVGKEVPYPSPALMTIPPYPNTMYLNLWL